MTLVGQINNLATRLGTEFKAVYTKQGDLTSLNTSNRSSLVSAINELYAGGGSGGGVAINDTTPSTSSVYSSSKTDSQIASAVASKATIDDSNASASSTYSSNKINSSIATAVATKPSINDGANSTTSVYSSSKTDSQINTAVSNLVNGSPAALDTLKELSDALGGDANFATTVTTALGNRLRFDSSQVLNGTQKSQGLANLGAQAAADIGDVSTNFVITFEGALS